MRMVIIANGWLNHPLNFKADEIVIAADGGARHCLAHGISPHSVIGDLDSLDESDLQKLASLGAQIIQYPRRKDFTDLELAIQFAIAQGATEIVIHAALGARWDQTLANLLLPVGYPDVSTRLVDGPQEMRLVRGGEQVELDGEPGDIVSLIALSEEARGIRTENLEYGLEDETLFLGSTRGISNVMLGQNAKVFLKEGYLICTTIHNTQH